MSLTIMSKDEVKVNLQRRGRAKYFIQVHLQTKDRKPNDIEVI